MKIRNFSWNDFDKFKSIQDAFLPISGEGDNMATQIVTAVSKLVYRWLNDGDVYDNTMGMYGEGGENISSYANWLYEYVPETKATLKMISKAYDDEYYVSILYQLCEITLNEDFLANYVDNDTEDSIYDLEDEYFRYEDPYEEDDDFEDDDEWY